MKLRQDVRDWLQKVEVDFESAKILSRKRKQNLVDAACFHSRQCAEKYLKALLTRHRISFPKTHDLVEPTLELLRPDLIRLRPFAVNVRYPGEFATKKDAKVSLKAMGHVRERIRTLLIC